MWNEFLFTRAVFMAILWLLAGNGLMMLPTSGYAQVGGVVTLLGLLVLMAAVLLYLGILRVPARFLKIR